MCDFNIDLFIKRIQIVTTLVSLAKSEDNGFKSLWSIIEKEAPDYFSPTLTIVDPSTKPEIHKEIADAVFAKQLLALEKAQTDTVSNFDYYRQGRLITFSPAISLHDGTAQADTGGYYDFVNYPPYSTWLYWFFEKETDWTDPRLVAWVPPEHVELATMGMMTIPEESIVFVSDESFQSCYKPILSKHNLLI